MCELQQTELINVRCVDCDHVTFTGMWFGYLVYNEKKFKKLTADASNAIVIVTASGDIAVDGKQRAQSAHLTKTPRTPKGGK